MNNARQIARDRQNNPELDFELRTRSAMSLGYTLAPTRPLSLTPATAHAHENNVALLTGTRHGAHQLVGLTVQSDAPASVKAALPAGGTALMGATATTYLFLADPAVQGARYVIGDRPLTTVLADGGMVLWPGSTELSGQKVTTSAIVAARDLPVLAADDLARLMDAINAAGGERGDAPDEPPLVDPRWPVDIQVATMASLLRKALRRLDAIEADDLPADKPRRPHRRVNPLPETTVE